MARKRVLTRSEAQQWDTKQFKKPRTSASLSPKELNAQRKASGQSTKPRSRATLTRTEKADWTTKEFQKPITQKPAATSTARSSLPAVSGGGQPPAMKPPSPPSTGSGSKPPVPQGSRALTPRASSTGRMEKVIQGSHEIVRPKGLPAPSTASKLAKGLGRIPVIGAIFGAAVGGNQIKDLPGPQRIQADLVNWAASKTGLAAKEQADLGPMTMKVSPRKTVTAPAPSTPSVPSKTVSAAPKAPTSKGSTSPAPKSSPKPSQKATGASKGQGKAMSGAELANFLGLSADSAVRTYMETGKHKYPSKAKK